MQKQPAYLLVLFVLASSMQVVAKNVDSVLIKYRLDSSFSCGKIVWIASHNFYLAEKPAPYPKASLSFVRKLSGNWEIIRFDSTLKYNQLTSRYTTIVPANNNWKYAEALQTKLAQIDIWPSSLLLRINFLNNRERSVEATARSHAIIYNNYNDYNCADVLVKNKEQLLLLASDTNIIAINIAARLVHTEQSVKRLDPGTNYINLVHDEMPGIAGNGTTVCIKEELFDTADIDFKKRYFLTSYSSPTIGDHAGIMATMAAGSGNSYYTGKGVAWKANITSADFRNLMPEPLDYYRQYHIAVQNHSYGTGIENEYAADAAAYDLTTWSDTTLLHIFSAGNSGTATSPSGRYTGIPNYANITGSFKMSKNSLAIGGTDSFYHTETLSSKGPTYDGRIKPELVAFGIDGTSGAAALTSGVALLLKQQLRQQSGDDPSAALVKALLIDGCDDIDDEGPAFTNGYGSLNAYRSLKIAANRTFLTAAISEGVTHQQRISVPVNTSWLKITLVWTDTPASPLSAIAIMNDLDIELYNITNGSVTKPWILSTAANADSLQLQAIRGNDSLNTVEVISLLHPPAGDYIINIKAKKLYTASQSYAIAWHIEPADTLFFTSPAITSACFANTLQAVRWQSSYANNAFGKLEYKYDENSDWSLITNALPLRQQWYKWQTPDSIAKVLLRITSGTKAYTSDTFIVSKPLTLQLGYYCNDSLYLYWNKQRVNNYRVYNLGDTLMEPVAVITDTFYQTATSNLKSNYVAVTPIIDNIEATRSAAINFTQQGVACYINSFLADLLDDSVRLTLTIGTNFNIDKIVLQKLVNGTFADINFTLPQQTLTYYFVDKQLIQGGNSYRIQLILNDGQVLYTHVETIYYLGNKLYLLYPNPIKRGKPLYIVNRFSDGDLYANLYDITGRLVLKLDLKNALNSFNTNHLPPGIYMLLFNDGSKKLGVEKLLLQ